MIDKIQLQIEIWRSHWDTLVWRASDENREMVRERLKQHDEAMKKGEPGPYFEAT